MQQTLRVLKDAALGLLVLLVLPVLWLVCAALTFSVMLHDRWHGRPPRHQQ